MHDSIIVSINVYLETASCVNYSVEYLDWNRYIDLFLNKHQCLVVEILTRRANWYIFQSATTGSV